MEPRKLFDFIIICMVSGIKKTIQQCPGFIVVWPSGQDNMSCTTADVFDLNNKACQCFWYSWESFSKKYPGDFIGCFVDNPSPRAMPHLNDNKLDNNKCISCCKDLEFSYAGTEYANQCFCGNYLTWTNAPTAACNYVCSGNATQKCGGAWRLSVYQTGVNRTNKQYRFIADRKLNATPFSTASLRNTLQGRNVECATYCKREKCSMFSVVGDICAMYNKYEYLCSGYLINTMARVYMLN